MPLPRAKIVHRDHHVGSSKSARPPLVDFHNAPEAFLPADFELQDPTAKRKKSALRSFTMTMERPFSPPLGNENKPGGLRRAQSVRDVTETVPAPVPTMKEDVPPVPVYSVVQERAKTTAKLRPSDETITGESVPCENTKEEQE